MSDPEDDELEKKYFSSYSAFAAESEAAASANESGVVSMEAGSREASVSVGDKMYDGVPVGESEID